jgi:hypothetical protein
VSQGVDVVRRGDGQSCEVTFRIVVGDESIGRAARAGGVSQGFWILERSDSVRFKRGLKCEGVLERLSLTESDVFSRSDVSASTIVNLMAVSKLGVNLVVGEVRTSWVT